MERIQKPVGIYVATILIVFFGSIMPVAAVVAEIRSFDGEVPFTLVFVSFLLPVFTLGAAIWAFSGDDAGRVSLLVTLSLNFLWWMFLSIMNVANAERNGQAPLMLVLLIMSFIRPIAFFITFWWYFTKSDVVTYYKQLG